MENINSKYIIVNDRIYTGDIVYGEMEVNGFVPDINCIYNANSYLNAGGFRFSNYINKKRCIFYDYGNDYEWAGIGITPTGLRFQVPNTGYNYEFRGSPLADGSTNELTIKVPANLANSVEVYYSRIGATATTASMQIAGGAHIGKNVFAEGIQKGYDIVTITGAGQSTSLAYLQTIVIVEGTDDATTIVLPDVSILVGGWEAEITNKLATATITVNDSLGNLVKVIPATETFIFLYSTVVGWVSMH